MSVRAVSAILHDLQKTISSYLQAHDELFGSSLLQEVMESYDENHDGVIDYDETGRKGRQNAIIGMLAHALDVKISQEYGSLKGGFIEATFQVKCSDRNYNAQGHDFLKELMPVAVTGLAFELSQNEVETPDLFVPGMTFGRGRWPAGRRLLI